MALVLLIDDDASMRSLMRQALEAVGHDVLEAPDGRRVLELLRRSRPDLMVTDILMPNKEGLETIRDVKAAMPRLPIIAISGGGRIDRRDLLDAAREFGADAALAKPFRPAELRALVADLLDRSRS